MAVTEYEKNFRNAELPQKLDRIEELLGSLSEEQAKGLQDAYRWRGTEIPAILLIWARCRNGLKT